MIKILLFLTVFYLKKIKIILFGSTDAADIVSSQNLDLSSVKIVLTLDTILTRFYSQFSSQRKVIIEEHGCVSMVKEGFILSIPAVEQYFVDWVYESFEAKLDLIEIWRRSLFWKFFRKASPLY